MEKLAHGQAHFRRTEERVCAVGIALLSLFLLCFVPDYPLGFSTNSPADQLEENKAHRIDEIFRLYGVIKFNAPNFKDDFAWDLAEVIRAESRRYALDPMLVLAVIKTESAFDQKAISAKGAHGLMQILPSVANAVAEEMEIKIGNGKKSLDDPVVNIKLGVSYLKSLKQKFRNLSLALAAYKWGPSEISDRMNNQIPVPLEYSKKVLDYYRLFRTRPPAMPKVIPQTRQNHTQLKA